MTPEEIRNRIAVTSEALDDLIEMIMDRDEGEALELITILHETAKLYAADQLPTAKEVILANEENSMPRLDVVFTGRNVRTAQILIQHLKIQVDDDGIPY